MRKPSKNSLPFNWINPEDFEFLCFNLAKELLEFKEPIPDYKTRDNSLLESSLAAPRLAYEYANADLAQQASVLFYSIIKNHPFQNGNKRIAVMTLLIFLSLNGMWLKIPPNLLYEIALLVAESKTTEREVIIKKNKDIIEKYIINKK